jgi:hypothetical protein
MSSDAKREMLRHTLATVAYRGAKVLRGMPLDCAGFTPGEGGRTPLQILAHVGDLLDWALSMADGREKWNPVEPSGWEAAEKRFFAGLKAFDDYLASEKPLRATPEKLFQGPVADALTHVGQLAMLRRLGGSPVRGENYAVAGISAGMVGPGQAAARREFA